MFYILTLMSTSHNLWLMHFTGVCLCVYLILPFIHSMCIKGNDIFLRHLNCWWVKSHRLPTITGCCQSHWLLLRIYCSEHHILHHRTMGNLAVLTWNPHPYWIAFVVLRGAWMLLGDKSRHQYYPAVNAVNYLERYPYLCNESKKIKEIINYFLTGIKDLSIRWKSIVGLIVENLWLNSHWT